MTAHLPTPVDDVQKLPLVLNAVQIQSVLGVSRTTFYELAKRGAIPCLIRVGRQWRAGRDALLRWIEAGGLQQAWDAERAAEMNVLDLESFNGNGHGGHKAARRMR